MCRNELNLTFLRNDAGCDKSHVLVTLSRAAIGETDKELGRTQGQSKPYNEL